MNGLPTATDPAAAAFRADLDRAQMRAAQDDGRFSVVSYQHPLALAWVAVGDGRLGMRLDVVGYPGAAPAGEPWDLATSAPMEPARWPVGGRPVFRRDWSPRNGNGPYLGVDRTALATHPNWRNQFPGRVWTPTMRIYDYLSAVHEALSLSSLPG